MAQQEPEKKPSMQAKATRRSAKEQAASAAQRSVRSGRPRRRWIGEDLAALAAQGSARCRPTWRRRRDEQVAGEGDLKPGGDGESGNGADDGLAARGHGGDGVGGGVLDVALEDILGGGEVDTGAEGVAAPGVGVEAAERACERDHHGARERVERAGLLMVTTATADPWVSLWSKTIVSLSFWNPIMASRSFARIPWVTEILVRSTEVPAAKRGERVRFAELESLRASSCALIEWAMRRIAATSESMRSRRPRRSLGEWAEREGGAR
uniref:Uncharacterized protein n=1 Tax=Ananas comosus var. bracteatus TaxID=296719 RepID=A0A6V7PUT8_ANACO|nr:unnamed protein product [Ananas comosus var. bracteatus]